MFLHITDFDGIEHKVEALEGWRVMEIIRDWGFPIKAECGGAGLCATCHVYNDQDWVTALVPPQDEELDRLDEVSAAEANSRLSCQILMRPEFDGLKVRLGPGRDTAQVGNTTPLSTAA